MATLHKKLEQPRIKLSRPQWTIYEAGWKPEARFRVGVCGRRFGKTFVAVEEIRRACRMAVLLKTETQNEIWYGAPTFNQGKRVFWRLLKRGIPRSWLAAKPNESTCSLLLKSGHVVRIVGLDAYDNLRGSGLFFFLGDEWQDVKPAAWTETLRPMLSTAKGHALFIGTPKGFANPLYEFFIKGQPGGDPDHKSFTFTTIQGGNVPPEEVATAKRDLDERTYRQEYEASFETFSGRVIYAFSRAGNVKPCPMEPHQPLHIGIDFNINPMSATVWQEQHDGSAHQVDEVIIPTSNTDELVAEIRRRYARGNSLQHITAYPDPAGAQRRTSAQGRTDIGILQASGMRVLAMSSHPLVRDRHNVTNARFCAADGTRKAFVDPKCRKSIEAYEGLAYKEGTNEPDKNSGYDHVCFTGDTLVDTINGHLPINRIPSSGYVRTWNGEYVPYENAGLIKRMSEVVEVKFSDGSSVKCTPDHIFLTGCGWLQACDLRGQNILSWYHLSGDTSCPQLSRPPVKNITENATISVVSTSNQTEVGFIELYGQMHMDQSQKDIMSITKTKIEATTPSTIWNSNPQALTCNTIQVSQNGELGPVPTWFMPSMPLKSGTVPPKEVSGTEDTTQRWALKCTSNQKRNASCVENLTLEKPKASLSCSVQIIAKHSIAESQGSITRHVVACIAKRNSSAINTSTTNAAQNHAVQNSGGRLVVSVTPLPREDVYCLTVPTDGCFALADGSIVGNCDGTGYYFFARHAYKPPQHTNINMMR